jgi:Family of unknown function (DUF6340)
MQSAHLLKTPFFALLLLLALAALPSCRPTARLNVLQPAQMKIPDHLSTIAVVDRSKPSKGWLNVLEGLVTGEAIGQDRRSREQAMDGIINALTRTPRFRVKNTGIELEGSRAGNSMNYPLEWSRIEQICAEHGADAVLALESFDSDNYANARRVETKQKKDGKQTVRVSYNAEQRTTVRMGWRLYDPKTKIIADEFTTNDYLNRTAHGDTERSALANLPSQINMTREVARVGGISYGMRIAPVYVDLSRSYYGKVKGAYKVQMEQAARHAKANDWEKAAGIWKNVCEGAKNDPKTAGRAAFNMAVASEMRGNLDLALEWAGKAWTQFGNKQARTYIETLKMRQNDVRKVEYQLNKKV